MSRLKTGTILCLSTMACTLLMIPYPSLPVQNQESKYAQYRDRLDKLKTLAVAKMRIAGDQANQQFQSLAPELKTMSAAEIDSWLRNHKSEEDRAKQIWKERVTRRDTIYKEYGAERERLEKVYRAGGLGKVGYVFIGDVEYDSSRRFLEAMRARATNIPNYVLTGKDACRLEDFEPLILKKEQLLKQKFETVITIYMALQKDLRNALGDPQTAGYVWISHGSKDEPAPLDDTTAPINRNIIGDLVKAAQNRYIMEKLPAHLAKIFEETQSDDENVKEDARQKLQALEGQDRELYDYVRSESLKVSLGLSYVEHFACESGAKGVQPFVDEVMGEDGIFIGYNGFVSDTGEAGVWVPNSRLSLRSLKPFTRTVGPTEFKSTKKPDPDPQKTIRNRAAAAKVTVATPSLFVQRDYWDPEKTKIQREFTYYMRSDGKAKIRHGKETIWYNDGKTIAYVASRRDGEFHGTMTRYWASGKVFDITIFNAGGKEGAYVSYWNNGKIRSQGEFRKDRKCGPWSFFLENGNLEAQGPYYRKFSTIIVGCRNMNSDDPTRLDDGLSWECGNKFGKWTLPDGREQVFEQRGDLDNEVDRAIWGRPKSALENSLESQIKTLNDESTELRNRIDGVANKKRTGDEGSRLASLEKKIKELNEEYEKERERINQPIRAKILAKEAKLEDLCPVIFR